MTQDTCTNCLYWGGDRDKQNGQETDGPCREDSPRVFMTVVPEGPPDKVVGAHGEVRQNFKAHFASQWPTVGGARWCGKHKAVEPLPMIGAALEADQTKEAGAPNS